MQTKMLNNLLQTPSGALMTVARAERVRGHLYEQLAV